MEFEYTIGATYTRRDIAIGAGLPDLPKGGIWSTGYVRHQNAHFLFCGVGVAGRTGHDYGNYFDGEELLWSGKTGSRRGQPIIEQMLAADAEVHVFWRLNDRDKFTYAGLGRAVEVFDHVPVRVRWRFSGSACDNLGVLLDEISPEVAAALPSTVVEGALKQVMVNKYERNPAARKQCLDAHGFCCKACSFDFEATYGDLGRGFIHVHHLRPISSIGETYELNPLTDLVPLCPNCHAMVHRADPPLTVAALAEQIQKGQP